MRVVTFLEQYGLGPKSCRTNLYGRGCLNFEKSGFRDGRAVYVRITASGSGPICPVEATVLNGFGDMFRRQIGRIFEIANCTGDLENPVVGPGTKTLLRHGALEQALAIGGETAESADVPRAHLRVAIELFT